MANNQGLYYYTKEEIDERLGKYSTTEQAVGTWLDSSTIYCKTIECGALPNANSAQTSTTLPNLKSLIKIEGVAVGSSGGILHLPHATPSGLASCVALSAQPLGTSDVVQVTIRTGSDRSNYTGYVTLYYTKEEAS